MPKYTLWVDIFLLDEALEVFPLYSHLPNPHKIQKGRNLSVHNINIFISHSWSYSGHYDRLAGWIFNEPWSSGQASLNFRNYSVPKDDPIHNAPTDRLLHEAILRQIAPSHVIVIPTGMYATHSKWITKELEGAGQYGKPILAVNPWGQQRKSSVVQQHATQSVGWNKQSVVDAIWALYRR